MKRSLLFLAFLFVCFPFANAQWTDVQNNLINCEFRVSETYWGGAPDNFDLPNPVTRTSLEVIGVGSDLVCYDWVCTGNCISTGNNYHWSYSGLPFNAEWKVWMQAYENDYGDICTYDVGSDDDYYSGYGVLRDNLSQQKIIFASSDFYPCNWNGWLAGNGSQWLFQNTNLWDQSMAMTWRYTFGDNSLERLNFGTVGNGQTKIDINATRPVSTSSGNLQYTNSWGGDSPDVWYRFSLNETSDVTISTSHVETNFDTTLRLYAGTSDYIGFDDNSGSGVTSTISTTLCPGTYSVMVEGAGNSTGVFQLSVSANSLGSPSISILDVNPANCADASDGSASVSVSGGFPPLSVNWSWDGGSASGTSVNGLPVGDATIQVTDACGQTSNSVVAIENGDTTPPVALCTEAVEVLVETGGPPAIISYDDLDNGSYDNCSIASTSLSQTSFYESDAGLNVVELILTDGNGNSNSCISVVWVTISTGVAEMELAAQVKLYPNPNSGNFTIDFSELDLKSEDAFVEIIDVSGKVVSEFKPLGIQMTIDLDLKPGIYLIRITNDGVSATKRMMVK